MATYRSSALCDVCQQNPKANSYNHCSQTCASIGAAFCSHCRQRPKSGSLDYCGKTCRDAANRYSIHGGIISSHAFTQAQGVVGAPIPATNIPNYSPTFPPFSPTPTTWSQAPVVPPAANRTVSRPIQLQPGKRRPLSEAPREPPQYGNVPGAQIPKSLAPGFKEYVRVNNRMVTSDSKIHFEQVHPAIELCIMCRRDPQREADHFCSQFCRERAMTKE